MGQKIIVLYQKTFSKAEVVAANLNLQISQFETFGKRKTLELRVDCSVAGLGTET